MVIKNKYNIDMLTAAILGMVLSTILIIFGATECWTYKHQGIRIGDMIIPEQNDNNGPVIILLGVVLTTISIAILI